VRSHTAWGWSHVVGYLQQAPRIRKYQFKLQICDFKGWGGKYNNIIRVPPSPHPANCLFSGTENRRWQCFKFTIPSFHADAEISANSGLNEFKSSVSSTIFNWSGNSWKEQIPGATTQPKPLMCCFSLFMIRFCIVSEGPWSLFNVIFVLLGSKSFLWNIFIL